MLKVLPVFSVLAAGALGNFGNFGSFGNYGGNFGNFRNFGNLRNYGGNFGNLGNFGFGMSKGSGMTIMPNGHPVVNPFTGHMGSYDVLNGLQNSHQAFGSTNDVTTDCRTYKRTHNEQGDEMTPDHCKRMRQETYNPFSQMLENIGGACRWSEHGEQEEGGDQGGWRGACLCPATGDICTRDRKGCHLHVDRETKEETCIGKPERFYNQLAGLLAKRGKQDFSMKIQYGAAGAQGALPFGLRGPAFIGRQNPYISHHVNQAFGNFGSQGYGSYGFAPSHQYRPAAFGGFGGYGPHGAYTPGAGAWANPASPHQRPYSPVHGYGAPWAPHFPVNSNQHYQTPAPHPAPPPAAQPAAATQEPSAATTAYPYPPQQATYPPLLAPYAQPEPEPAYLHPQPEPAYLHPQPEPAYLHPQPEPNPWAAYPQPEPEPANPWAVRSPWSRAY